MKPGDVNVMTDSKPNAMAMDKSQDATNEDKSQGMDAAMKSGDANVMTDSKSNAMAMDEMTDSANGDTTTDAKTTQPSAAKLKEGSFRDADRSHRGSGTATIYRGPDFIAMKPGDVNVMTDSKPNAMAMDKSQDATNEDKSQGMDAAMKSGDANVMTDSKSNAMAMDEMTDSANGDTTTDAKTTQPSAAKLKEGSFRDADRSHRGSGTATIYRGPDGSNLLRLEDFSVSCGISIGDGQISRRHYRRQVAGHGCSYEAR